MLTKDFLNFIFFELIFAQKIFIVFAFAFVLRLIFFCIVLMNVTYLAPDSFDYIRLARNIIENNIYGSLGSPEIFRVPLYPFLMSGFMLLFKTNFIPVLLLFQAMLDSFTAVLTMKSTQFLFKENSENIGFITGILYSLSPICIAYSAKVLSETVFVFLFLLLFVICLNVINRKKTGAILILFRLIFIGILAGTLCLTRAVFIPLTVLFLLWLALRTKKARYVLVATIFLSLIPGLWIVRNHFVCGYAGITSVSDVFMYRYDACSVLAKINSISFREQQSKIDAELAKFSTQKGVAEYCSTQASSVIKTHPFLYTYLQCKNSISTLFPAANDLFEAFGIITGGKGTLGVIRSGGLIKGITHYFNGRNDLLMIALLLAVALTVFYGFAIYGILMVLKKTLRTVALDHLFILLILAYFFIVGGAAATPRFRVPMEPFLSIYVAVGIIFLLKNLLVREKESCEKN